jgi:hypothetical protein
VLSSGGLEQEAHSGLRCFLLLKYASKRSGSVKIRSDCTPQPTANTHPEGVSSDPQAALLCAEKST